MLCFCESYNNESESFLHKLQDASILHINLFFFYYYSGEIRCHLIYKPLPVWGNQVTDQHEEIGKMHPTLTQSFSRDYKVTVCHTSLSPLSFRSHDVPGFLKPVPGIFPHTASWNRCSVSRRWCGRLQEEWFQHRRYQSWTRAGSPSLRSSANTVHW